MSYAADVAAGVAEQRSAMRATIQTAVGKLFEDVLVGSPIKTGKFRSNWQVVLGADTLALDDLPIRGTSESAREIFTRLEGLPDGDFRVFFTNLLPYGPRLEFDGWSGQAPRGFVRINAARFPMILRQAAMASVFASGGGR